ncbi:trypsin [Dictyocaulus viviparus]|uniref:Trypsin n=1 Tax=Dictyocaulus viviparus TaxID=29172 RepID=A0A0D8XV90_DICVI|nr:trypsin [Dictyocaulus viviparus]
MNNELKEICGRQENSTERNYPWAVSIMLKNGANRLGGSIISPYHIITAAHGFMSFQKGDEDPCIMVNYRSHGDVQDRLVAYGGKCIRGYSPTLPNHPNCTVPAVTYNKIRSVMIDQSFALNTCHNGHDWAIIELEESPSYEFRSQHKIFRINFSDSLRPICLPPPSPIIGHLVTVAGWGRNYVFNESGPMIHEIPMIISPKCQRPWSDKGDSGSGMEQIDERGRSILLAITSFGTKGCPANELARFTRVSNYLLQICTTTGICYSQDDELN